MGVHVVHGPDDQWRAQRHFRDHLDGETAARHPRARVAGRSGAHPPLATARPLPTTTSELAPAIGVSDELLLEALQAYNGRGRSSLQGPIGKRTDAATLEDSIGTEDPDLSGPSCVPT
jgi:hypothetical protein